MEAASESQLTAPLSPRWTVGAAVALIAGLVLRLWMLKKFPQVSGDSLIYGGLAKNLLLHGRYAITDGSGVMHATLIRLPGYPLFLALCFKLFGMENYDAVAYVQTGLELLGCLLLAGFVWRIAKPELKASASMATLWLAALCPFTASYAAAPLAETPTLFVIALALWALAGFLQQPGWRDGLLFTFALTCAALLRPDGALVGMALAPGLVVGLRHAIRRNAIPMNKVLRIGIVCVLLAMTPFAAWTVRNWRVFHVIEPLAPRYATDPGENTYPGWVSWVKSWCLDFVSTYDIYWNVPGGPLNLSKLPARAFDSPEQRAETEAVAKAYDENGQDFSLDIDALFAKLAAERAETHPLRTHIWLPLGRMVDMWLRPRVENLPIDLDWWVYKHHYAETRFSWAYAALNALYLLLGVAGLCLRPKFWPSMLLYFVLRSALLMTVEAPEGRYTLECFPMLFALGGIAISNASASVTRTKIARES